MIAAGNSLHSRGVGPLRLGLGLVCAALAAAVAFSAWAAPVACTQAPLAQLRDDHSAPVGSIVSNAAILPSEAQAEFIYLQPAGQSSGQPVFRVFLSEVNDDGKWDDRALDITRIVHPVSNLSDVAKGAGADASNAYDIGVDTLSERPWWLLLRATLTVAVCQKDTAKDGTATDRLVGLAKLPLWVSNKPMDIFAAFVLMVGVYLFAGWMRMLADKKAARVSNRLSERFTPGGSTRVSARISGDSADLKPLDYFDPVVLSADIFNRASLSQFQILIFLMLVGYGATYSMLRTGTLSELSPSIVYLLGIPAVGALGSQAVTATRGAFSVDNWSWLVSHGVLAVDDPGTARPLFRDLLMSGKQIDLYRLQAFTFTIIVGVALIYSGVTNLETFKVPDTLLQILGLSQVVFVGGRLTQPATIGDTDNLITELRKRVGDLRVAAATGIDVDAKGQPLYQATPGTPAIRTASIDDARKAVPNAVARYEETADEVEVLLKGLTYRDVVTDALNDPFRWGVPQPAAAPTPPGPPSAPPTAPPPAAPPPGPPPAAPPAAVLSPPAADPAQTT
jgi:hypothetical protein